MYRIHSNGKKDFRHVPDLSQAAWISYQMMLAGITQQKIADSVGVTATMVRSVIYGKKTSPRVQLAIAHSLGKNNWADLVGDSRRVAA